VKLFIILIVYFIYVINVKELYIYSTKLYIVISLVNMTK